MTDPVKQPIAALVERWRDERRLHPAHRLVVLALADEIEAAIAAQVALWERGGPGETMRPPTPASVRDRCIADLQGKEGPEPKRDTGECQECGGEGRWFDASHSCNRTCKSCRGSGRKAGTHG